MRQTTNEEWIALSLLYERLDTFRGGWVPNGFREAYKHITGYWPKISEVLQLEADYKRWKDAEMLAGPGRTPAPPNGGSQLTTDDSQLREE